MEQWQDAASRQAELLTARLNELLSAGLGWLRSELGVDAGLEPVPPWVAVLAGGAGLLLLLALWASLCRAVFGRRPAASHVDDGTEVKRGGRTSRPEEPRRKKKKPEKKAQPNGRAVSEPQEEAAPSGETVPHHQQPPAEGQAEKTPETKKSKKKSRQAVKETKTVTADGKEPEEGTWETKVSNKEKREQRKKDKGSSDGSASPGEEKRLRALCQSSPKPRLPPPPPANHKKKKESAKVKSEKVEAVSAADREAAEEAAPDMAAGVPAHAAAPDAGSWTSSAQRAPLWRPGIDESWTVIDRPVPSKQMNVVSLAGLGVAPKPQPVGDLPWLSQARVDDEWSGLNGGSADPSSDWNAPSEAWGNYEEPPPESPPAQEQPLPEPATVTLTAAADDDEDVKDKGDATADGAAKTKKKKKKKKKTAEDGGTAEQVEEPVKEVPPVAPVKEVPPVAPVKEVPPVAPVKKQPPVQEKPVQPARAAAVEMRGERPAKDATTQKAAVTQVPPTEGESTAKQNNLPAPPQQRKAEESPAPKAAKKKKARRET